MDSQQVSGGGSSIWRRMYDTPSVVRAWPATTTLLCVLVVLQILRSRMKHDDEAPAPVPAPPAAMSRTRLVALSLVGCVALDLILSHWVLFLVTFVYMFS